MPLDDQTHTKAQAPASASAAYKHKKEIKEMHCHRLALVACCLLHYVLLNYIA